MSRRARPGRALSAERALANLKGTTPPPPPAPLATTGPTLTRTVSAEVSPAQQRDTSRFTRDLFELAQRVERLQMEGGDMRAAQMDLQSRLADLECAAKRIDAAFAQISGLHAVIQGRDVGRDMGREFGRRGGSGGGDWGRGGGGASRGGFRGGRGGGSGPERRVESFGPRGRGQAYRSL